MLWRVRFRGTEHADAVAGEISRDGARELPFFEGAFDVAFGVVAGDGLAFVVLFFAARERDDDFGSALLQIDLCGDCGEAFLIDADAQLADLFAMQEQFALAALA